MRAILRCSVVAFALIFVFSTAMSGKGGKIKRGSELVMQKAVLDEPSSLTQITHSASGLGVHTAGALTFVDVAEMFNAFGTANTGVNPLAYDPISGAIALVHRGGPSYATASGSIWYTMSEDGGATWTRSTNSVNGPSGVPDFGRYPSMAISNYEGAPGVVAYFAYPQLNPGDWGYICYGVDLLGGFNAFVVEDQGANNYWSNLHNWASDNSSDAYWTCMINTTPTEVQLWHTDDFGVTVDKTVPPPLAGDQFVDTWSNAPGDAMAGVSYIGFVAQWASQVGTSQEGIYDFGVISSTDGGATWSSWSVANWKSIPALSDYDDLSSFTGVRLAYDFLVDDEGFGHFVTTLIDTATTPESLSIVEIYQTASGWDAKIIAPQTTTLQIGWPDYPLDQMENELFSARSADGTAFAAKWIDAVAEGDSTSDMFISYRAKEGEWVPAINMTQTPTVREVSTHLAPRLGFDGASYIAHLTRTYSTVNPDSNLDPIDEGPYMIAYANYAFTLTSVEKANDLVPSAFSLAQNYPNPFNPSTKIQYGIPAKSLVTLKVYNVLGEEVATLVNSEQEAGSYLASFDAAELSSGVYLYKLQASTSSRNIGTSSGQAGGFTETKKMMFVK